jgi:hypothetical protein
MCSVCGYIVCANWCPNSVSEDPETGECIICGKPTSTIDNAYCVDCEAVLKESEEYDD